MSTTAREPAGRTDSFALFALVGALSCASLSVALATGHWWPFAVTPLVALAASLVAGLDNRRGLGPVTTGGLLLIGGWFALQQGRSGIEGLPAGIDFLAYATWAVLLRRGRFTKLDTLQLLGIFHLAATALSEHSWWVAACLPPFVFFTLLCAWATATPRVEERLRRLASRQGSVSTTIVDASRGRSWNGPLLGTLVVIVIGVIVFLGIPRRDLVLAATYGEGIEIRTETRTGYTEHVQLRGATTLSNDDAVALTIRITEFDSDEPVDVAELFRQHGYREPYVRGTVMTDYENGYWSRWKPSVHSTENQRLRRVSGRIRDDSGEAFEATIRLNEWGTGTLFTVGQIIEIDGTSIWNPARDVFVLESDPRRDTRWLRQRRRRRSAEYDMRVVIPSADRGWKPIASEARPTNSGKFVLRDPADQERIADLANRIVADAVESRTASDRETALALVAYLNSSGWYEYATGYEPYDATADPVADFLFNTRVGHCEFFASSLALMLRSRGIPSRLVSGYRGGDADPETGEWIVRRKHAHTWVEAWLDGHWVTLDATTGGDADEEDEAYGVETGRLSVLWQRYVTNYSGRRQSQLFLVPFRGALERVSETGARLGETVAAMAGGRQRTNENGGILAWLRGGMGAYVLAAVAWLILRRRRTAQAVADSQEKGGPVTGSGGPSMWPFYERFRRWTAQRGLTRRSSETAREFADRVVRIDAGVERDLVPGVHWIAELFAGVRYGGRRVSPEQDRRVENVLGRLEATPRPEATT